VSRVQTFVGREPELQALREQFHAARAGEPRLVLLQGPAGVGKTSLLSRFAAELDDDDTRVLAVSGDESELELPLALVDQIVRHARLDVRLEATGEHVAAGTVLLEALAELAPVVLIVDDAHWVDPLSLRALLFAARRLSAEAALIVLAARGDAVDAIPRGLHALFDGRHGERLTLRDFDANELGELADALAAPLSSTAAQRLHAHTGGNALYATALLVEYGPEQWERPEQERPAPRSFAALVHRRLNDAGTDARRLAQALAILGGSAAVGLAASVARVDDDPLSAVDDARRANLLELHDGTLRFPHPLVRAAIHQQLAASERAALHANAAEALADDEAAALRHAAAAATGHDAELAERLEAYARRQVKAGAWAAAASALRLASRLAPEREQRDRRLLEALEATLYSGDAAGARRLVPEAERTAPGPLRDCVLAYAAINAGNPLEAHELLRRAWAACDPVAQRELASKIAERSAFLGLLRLRATETIEWGRRAAELVADDPVSRRLSVWALATALDQVGRHAEAIGVLDDVERRLAPGDRPPDRTRASIAMTDDRHAEAREQLSADAVAIRRLGSSVVAALAYSWLARADFAAGAWDDAIVHAERAVALAVESDDVAAQVFAYSAAMLVPAARGDDDGHAAALAAVPAVFENHVLVRAIGLATHAAAHVDAATVLDVLEPIRRLQPRDGIDDQGHWPWAHLYAGALVDVGRLDDAASFLDEYDPLAYDRRSARARLARVRGRLHALSGDAPTADAAFIASIDVLTPLAMPYELALSELAHGQFLRRDGRRRAAAERLRSAVRRLDALGARPALERALRELDACGLTPAPRRTSAGPDTLTPQERAVERLAITGLTNREIAGELMLSVKTVERHLSHVFVKRGVSSRAELVTVDP
jgi:DNA-binding CsgD family transcriptional regulator